jgi:hypothetical protein
MVTQTTNAKSKHGVGGGRKFLAVIATKTPHGRVLRAKPTRIRTLTFLKQVSLATAKRLAKSKLCADWGRKPPTTRS